MQEKFNNINRNYPIIYPSIHQLIQKKTFINRCQNIAYGLRIFKLPKDNNNSFKNIF